MAIINEDQPIITLRHALVWTHIVLARLTSAVAEWKVALDSLEGRSRAVVEHHDGLWRFRPKEIHLFCQVRSVTGSGSFKVLERVELTFKMDRWPESSIPTHPKAGDHSVPLSLLESFLQRHNALQRNN